MADDRKLREQLRSLAQAPAPAPDLAAVVRRGRVHRVRRMAVALAVAGILAAGVIVPLVELSGLKGATEPATGESTVVRFEAAPGWHVREVPPLDGMGLPSAWAANVPFDPADVAGESPTIGYPDATIEALPRDGVVLVVSVVVESRNPLPADPRFDDPSLILDEPQTGFEGQRPGTSQALATATLSGRFVSAAAFFGSNTVEPKLLHDANEELSRVVVTPRASPTSEIDDFGVRMRVPEDWDRSLFSFGDGSAELRAGTMPITSLYEPVSSRHEMGADDVALVLSESNAVQDRFEPVQLPIELREEDECPTCEILDGGKAPPAGHTLFARTFSVGSRRFLLYGEFGSPSVTETQLEALNDVLATLEIDADGALGPTDPGAAPTVLPQGPSFTATGATSFDYLGLRLAVPPRWTALAAPLSEPTVAPVIGAFGSWPAPAGGTCGPEVALDALPADGALVWIMEHPAPSNRGDYYRFQFFAHDRTHQPMRWECGSGAPSRMDLWNVSGRFLEVHVAIGPSAGPGRVAEVEALLNSLHVA